MANAKIRTPEGISVDVSGTPDEITAVVEQMRAQLAGGFAGSSFKRRAKGERVQIPNLIQHLKTEEYFKTPRGLGEIQRKLAEMGHHYPVTTLSGAMQAEVRPSKRTLRRFKQDGKYVYVQ